jgi:hypothetical protein
MKSKVRAQRWATSLYHLSIQPHRFEVGAFKHVRLTICFADGVNCPLCPRSLDISNVSNALNI